MSEGSVCLKCGAPVLATSALKSGWAHTRPGSGHAAEPAEPEAFEAIAPWMSEEATAMVRARDETPRQKQERAAWEQREQLSADATGRRISEERTAMVRARDETPRQKQERAAQQQREQLAAQEERRRRGATSGIDPGLVQLGSIVLVAWGVISAFTEDGTTSSGRLAISILLVIAGVALWRWANEEQSRRLDRWLASRDARPGPDPSQDGE